MRCVRSGFGVALAAGAMLLFAGQAIASTWNFSWSGWIGGSHDSNTWSASRAGTHTWVKTSCHAVAPIPGGSFDVEVRRVRSLLPDVSLGTKRYTCNNTDEAKGYASDGSGPHKFRFPYVSQGSNGGISGAGHVNFP